MSVTLNFSIWISFLLQHGRGVRTSVHGSAPNDFLVSADWFFNHSQSFFRSAEINLCFVSIWNTAFYNADFVGRLRPLRCISKRNKTGQTEKGKTKAGIFRRTSKYRLFPLWEDLFLEVGFFQSVTVLLIGGFEQESHQQGENGYTGENAHGEGIVVKIGCFTVYHFLPRDAIVFEYAANESRDTP